MSDTHSEDTLDESTTVSSSVTRGESTGESTSRVISSEIVDGVLRRQIAWCKANIGDSGKGADFEAGFLEGLRCANQLLTGAVPE